MTLFDWILVLIVAGGAYYGWRRGLISQLGALIGLVAAVILCRIFADPLAASFGNADDSAQTRLLHTVLTYALIFAGCTIGSRIIVGMAGATVRTLHLKSIDRLAGVVFNILEWTLIYSIFLNMWIMVFPQTDIRSSRSTLTTHVVNFAPTVFGSETAQEIFAGVDSISERMRPQSARDTVPSAGDNLRDAAIERVAGGSEPRGNAGR